MKRKIKKPFNPFWLLIISVIFSFVVAGIVAAFNYGRMGKPELKKKTIKYTLFGFLIFCVGGLFLSFLIPDLFPSKPSFPGIGTVINATIGGLLAYKQSVLYAEWKLKNEFKKKV